MSTKSEYSSSINTFPLNDVITSRKSAQNDEEKSITK